MFATSIILALAMSAGDGGDDERLLRAAGVPTDAAGLVAFFRSRAPTDDALRALVKKLGDDEFTVREEAARDLVLLGAAAKPYLDLAAKSDDAEVRRRAAECLKKIGGGPTGATVAAAARTLGRLKPTGAAEALLAYAPLADGLGVADDVRAALAAVAVRDSKPEPALTAALVGKDTARRAAAGAALARAGEMLPEVRKLLKDPEPSVRLPVALALVARREKEAVAALIDVLPRLEPGQVPAVEEVLYLLADDKAPQLPPGSDAAARRTQRDVWAAWWDKEGKDIDLAKLDAQPPFQNYTMYVLLDAGRIAEEDAAKKTRWEITNLQKPLDAQMLPGGERVLIAEHDAQRVTERDLKGNVVWQHRLADGPLSAQRLRNGHTLIVTRSQIVELDRKNEPIFRLDARGPNEFFLRGQRGRNGDLGYIVNTITGGTEFVRRGADGKELGRFAVDVRTSGGRIEMLANGNVLVPLMDENRVVEFDPQGREVWQARYPQPVAAVRLANGQTVVTSMNAPRAAALDPTGKEVWAFDAGARVTRAWRR